MSTILLFYRGLQLQNIVSGVLYYAKYIHKYCTSGKLYMINYYSTTMLLTVILLVGF